MVLIWMLILRWGVVSAEADFCKDAGRLPDVARADTIRKKFVSHRGALIRGDSSLRRLALVFTGDEYADGGPVIRQTLRRRKVPVSFFFTGRFYRNPAFQTLIRDLRRDGHYLGAHSDQHLLYCDWTQRDSLLIGREQFRDDLRRNYDAMRTFGIRKEEARFFLPPYEWYNDTISAWTRTEQLELINFTPGTLSHADYTTPDLKNYRPSRTILQSIYDYEQHRPAGLNGFILLMHVGTHPARTDKLYAHLDELLIYLKKRNYRFVRVDQLF
ncbi:polysaccharide deacetylase family protein [Larkinella soli]|uniref:polysaccharide deacetylase family protein n=1 Tax=Larkinella soli TaxID=1770527 RepID=UPI000FFBCD30|nr:polysaccharide deacetylase family protein [Larkinella soli]